MAAGTGTGYTAPTIAPTGGNQGPAYASLCQQLLQQGFIKCTS